MEKITLDQAIEQISKANPFMGELLYCEDPLIDYVQKNITSAHFSAVHLERQKPYVNLIREKIEKLFLKEDVRVNFDEGMILDTTDHHNILNYPSIIGAHVISRFDTILKRKIHGDYFVLDCGNVSFSEVLNKRGIELNGKHINLYPKKDKNKLISRYPLYEYDLVKFARNSGNKFSDEEFGFLKKMQEMIDKIDFSTCERLSDQIVKINFHLWQEFFGDDVRGDARRCVTLEHDEILIKYLADHLLKGEDNILSKALFDQDFREVIIREFEGVYGAWNYGGDNTGTYFFWGFNKDDGKTYRMDLDGDVLVNREGKVRDIKLVFNEVSDALKEGIIIPAIFTKFTAVAFHIGCKVMGGPGQTEYVFKLHNAWIKALEKTNDKELELIRKMNVLNMNCGDLAFFKNEKGDIVKEWGFDIAKSKRFTRKYLERLSSIPFKYFLYPVIPISYYRLTPADKRKKIDYNENDLYRGFNWVK